MMNIVLFGAPGAGKGTQAMLLARQFRLEHVSTGDLLRKEIAAGTQWGQAVEALLARGEFAPDSMVVDMLDRYMQQHSQAAGFIFDGFPRNTAQAGALDALLARTSQRVRCMISLDVPREELVQRLLLRGETSGRADDQDAGVIGHRIDVYHHKTEPVIHYYEGQQKYYPVSGTGSVEQVFERLRAVVEQIASHTRNG